MRRFISFRDFDWLLLGLVLLLSIISIFEIYSATLHTKFVGFETKQIFWLLGGLAAMFIFSVINYHRLLEAVPWIYGFCLVSLVAVLAVGTKVLGGAALDQASWRDPFPAIRMGETGADRGRGSIFLQPGGQGAYLERYLQGFPAGWPAHAAGAQATGPGNLAHLHPSADHRAVSGRPGMEERPDPGHFRSRPGGSGLGQGAETLPEAAADQLPESRHRSQRAAVTR